MAPGGSKPAKASTGDKMKQKSLMSFFNKATPASATSTTKTQESVEKKKAESYNTTSINSRHANNSRSSDIPAKNSSQRSEVDSTRSSNVPSSPVETPPTSDMIDIDMLVEDGSLATEKSETSRLVGISQNIFETSLIYRRTRTTRNARLSFRIQTKRLRMSTPWRSIKAYLHISPHQSRNNNLVGSLNIFYSGGTKSALARNKKARVSAVISDDDEQSEDDAVASFSKRLTKFRPTTTTKPQRKYQSTIRSHIKLTKMSQRSTFECG